MQCQRHPHQAVAREVDPRVDDAAVALAADDRLVADHPLGDVRFADRRAEERAAIARGHGLERVGGGQVGYDRARRLCQHVLDREHERPLFANRLAPSRTRWPADRRPCPARSRCPRRDCRTASQSAFRFSAVGSAGRGKLPSGVTLMPITSAPSASRSRGPTIEPAPLHESMTTLGRKPAGQRADRVEHRLDVEIECAGHSPRRHESGSPAPW